MFRRMFIGRNGPDQLSFGLSILALILNFIPGTYFHIVSLAILGLAVLRMFSRNIEQRRKENLFFMRLVNKPRTWYYNFKASRQQSKLYKVFKCDKCGQKLRVPRGKGKVAVKCSKCGNRMITTT